MSGRIDFDQALANAEDLMQFVRSKTEELRSIEREMLALEGLDVGPVGSVGTDTVPPGWKVEPTSKSYVVDDEPLVTAVDPRKECELCTADKHPLCDGDGTCKIGGGVYVQCPNEAKMKLANLKLWREVKTIERERAGKVQP